VALIVEYHPWLRLMLASSFQRSGFEVRCASNGAAGLRLAMRLGPELVIVGDSLPELSPEHLIAELDARRGVWATRVVRARDLLQRETHQPGHTSGRATYVVDDVPVLPHHHLRASRHVRHA
jgi:DNA-binding response OmpR family regulator